MMRPLRPNVRRPDRRAAMPRITMIDPQSATGDARRVLDAVRAQLGATPNFVRVLANSPKALEGFLGRRQGGARRYRLPAGGAARRCAPRSVKAAP